MRYAGWVSTKYRSSVMGIMVYLPRVQFPRFAAVTAVALWARHNVAVEHFSVVVLTPGSTAPQLAYDDPTKEQDYSESHSALVNKAYRTLLKPLSRGLYMLELEGVLTEEGTDSEADSGFLMELMEINEALDEARTPEDANEIGRDTKGK
ncbi:Iron-sulfur cluster co-chaperone protein HscB, mitochondrial [Liparis tanakae]|uniref:Iron-sulfur cluster co-chaperone protein HscB, mitochondrial n=1 Tax=Liparis tanakae TaxID=230148 RepID=A0A4Z2GBU7_9TELE|nr:Iron-sulfur cluster co-chaperone protein HscB, mitochondrial [Liparis tanakae]